MHGIIQMKYWNGTCRTTAMLTKQHMLIGDPVMLSKKAKSEESRSYSYISKMSGPFPSGFRPFSFSGPAAPFW